MISVGSLHRRRATLGADACASRVLWGAAETEVAVAPIVSESSGDVVMVAFSIGSYPMTQLSATLQQAQLDCFDGIAPSMAPSVVPGELCVHRLNLGGAMELATSACTMVVAGAAAAVFTCSSFQFVLYSSMCFPSLQ